MAHSIRCRSVGLLVMLAMLFGMLSSGCSPAQQPVQKPGETPQAVDNKAGPPKKITIRVGSSALGMAQQVVGTAIQTVVNEKAPGIKVETLVTGGSVENPRLLERGEIEMMSSAMAYEAFHGLKPYDKPIRFSFVAPYYYLSYFFITLKDSGIRTVADLKGKRVNLSDPGGAVPPIAKAILKAAGVLDTIKDSYSGYDDGVDELHDGLVDAVAVYTAATPPAYVEKICRMSDVVAVAIDKATVEKVIEENPQYFISDLSDAKYAMTIPKPFLAVGLSQGCYARDDLPEEAVYQFTKAMMENIDTIKKYTPQCSQISPKTALNGIPKGIPVHPGAARYYKEIGVWKEGLTVTQK